MFRFYISILLAVTCDTGLTQSSTTVNTARSQIQNLLRFQEKVYLHTDKSYYRTGENIWFSIYRVDATTHNPNLYSKFVYVELINQQNSVIRRIKVMDMDSLFNGNIKLPENLNEGEYCIRAYTNWMQNNSQEFFFYKNISVFNAEFLKAKTTVSYTTGKDSLTLAQVTFNDPEQKPFSGTVIYYKLYNKNNLLKDGLKTADNSGSIHIELPAQMHVTDIKCNFHKERPFKFETSIHIPILSPDFDCQFMPEGGSLLNNISQNIAFKAIGNNGLSTEIKGEVFDDNNLLIDTFRSIHNGMGVFNFKPEHSGIYHAKVTDASGLSKTFDLPQVQEKGITLQLTNTGNLIACKIISTKGFQYPDKLKLLVQCRGKFLENRSLTRDTALLFTTAHYPNGIIQFALVDNLGQVYAERLIFVLNEDLLKLTVLTDKRNYKEREKVNLSLHLQNNDTLPVNNGRLSIAVTDSKKVLKDSLHNNIMSFLLLSSDIKGNIENPDYYFNKNNPKTERVKNIDLLMLTQGWKRFDIGKYSQGTAPETPHYLEFYQRITGQAKTFWGKPANSFKVVLYDTVGDLKYYTLTDSNGYFVFEKFASPDSIALFAKVLSEKKAKRPEIHVNQPVYPFIPGNLFRNAYYSLEKKQNIIRDSSVFIFYKTLQQKYYYENGEKIYLLGEVTVKAASPNDPTVWGPAQGIPNIYGSLVERKITLAELQKFNPKSIEDAINLLPYINIDPINDKPINAYIDNFRVSLEEVLELEVSDLKSIGITPTGTKPSRALIIYLKPFKERMENTTVLYKSKITDLGYHTSDQFYIPKYDLPDIKKAEMIDDRTTIYWNPYLKTDVNGNCQVNFYTADPNTVYNIVVEGITPDGRPFRHTSAINRN